MRYDTVIFDLDGTLTNSHDGITNAVRYALNKMNLPIPDEAGLRKYIVHVCAEDSSAARREKNSAISRFRLPPSAARCCFGNTMCPLDDLKTRCIPAFASCSRPCMMAAQRC